MAMAMNGSPEWDSINECTSGLIDSITENPDSVAAALYEKQLLSRDEYRNEVFATCLHSNPYSKAQRIVAAIENKVRVNPRLFQELITVFDSQQGILIKQCAEELVRCYQEKLKITNITHKPQEKTGFICPYCGQCSFDTFFTLGCPQVRSHDSHVKPSSLSYPFLDIKHLSRKDEYLLYKKLKEDFDKVMSAFLNFCKQLSQSDTLAKVVKDIKANLMFHSIFSPTEKEKLDNSSTVMQVLAILCIRHASFYNYELIEHIINEFGSEDDKLELQKYLDEFKIYCTHNVFEVPASVLHPPQPDSNDPQFALKYSVEGIIDLNQVKSVCILVAGILCINYWDLHLLSIQEGCILLRLALSKAIAWKVLPFTPRQQAALSEIGLSIIMHPSKFDIFKLLIIYSVLLS